MADILYVYKNQVYVNLTNKCSGRCTFCVRNQKQGVGDSNLILEKDPTLKELQKAIDEFNFDGYTEFVYCGYGEPTCSLDHLIQSAKYFLRQHDQKIRVNTNGLGCLYNKRDILPELLEVVDSFSISLNAPNETRYDELVRPPYKHAFQEVLRFAKFAKAAGKEVTFSVLTLLSEEEIAECRILAEQQMGIPLKIRQYQEG